MVLFTTSLYLLLWLILIKIFVYQSAPAFVMSITKIPAVHSPAQATRLPSINCIKEYRASTASVGRNTASNDAAANARQKPDTSPLD